MTTRESMDHFIRQCEETLRFAEEQLEERQRQEHYNDEEFTQALQLLENQYNELAKMSLFANDQQREQLHRMRLRLQQIQNDMIIGVR
ncbi:MAG: YtzC family protein [Bacillales bacterium]